MPTLMPLKNLFPPSVMDAIPRLYTQENVKDPLCPVKFFDAMGAATWWVIEYDGEDTFFGFVTLGDPQCAELGYFYKSEITSAARMFERDLHYKPTRLSEVKREVRG